MTPSAKNLYYVDETGDLTLFDRKGHCLVGSQGVSSFFMVGVAHIINPLEISMQLESLRKEVLADPYFAGVPSMREAAGKTACFFHAKDDLPEIRYKVFKLLCSMNIKVQIIIRRKQALAHEAKRLYQSFGIKLTPNQVYDDLIKRLFKNLLHKTDNRIIIARRGKTDRLDAMQAAIDKARKNFQKQYNIPANSSVAILPAQPNEFAGLQIVDYYLWAMQRLYERHEDRFFNLLSKQFRLIIDLDDKRNHPYGEYYSDANPLTVQKIRSFQG
jgi:hypothetical protein